MIRNLISKNSPDPGIFLAAGTGFFGIGIAKEQLVAIGLQLPVKLFVGCVYGGAAIFLMGILLMVAAKVLPEDFQILQFGQKEFAVELACDKDIQLIHDFASHLLGYGSISPVRKMQQWYEVNPDIFYKVFQVHRTAVRESKDLVGYYAIFPMTPRAIKLLDEEQINGTSFTTEHIRSKRASGPPKAVYIGGIAAKGPKGKAATLEFLRQQVRKEYDRGVKLVYARPTTPEGMRLLRDSGFTPVVEPGEHRIGSIYRFKVP